MQILEFIQNHWFLVALFVVFVMGYVLFELRNKVLGPKQLTPTLATQYINRNNPVIFDLRDSEKFKSGHIIDARCIKQSDAEEELKRLKKDKDTPILLVCQQGMTSGVLGSRLKKQGFKEVSSLAGGMNAWKNAELPIEKG